MFKQKTMSSPSEDSLFQFECVDDDRLNNIDIKSTYYNVDDTSDLSTFINAEYSVLHLNIHSLASKISHLRDMLDKLKNKKVIVHFIMLCETFLNDHNANMFQIPGYNFVHKNRINRSRGGVAMYILDTFTFKERPDLCINIENQFESIAAEVKAVNGKKNLILAEIYRVPNTNERQSISRYEEMIAAINSEQTDLIVGTDQNFDYMKVGQNRNVSDLLDVFVTGGILPTILRPTRICQVSSTLIDNIYLKNERYDNFDSRIIIAHLSDHFPVLACMGQKSFHKKKEPLVFYHRPLQQERLQCLNNAIYSTNWNTITRGLNVSDSYDAFTGKLTNLIDEHVPERMSKIPWKAVLREPWMTSGLLKSSSRCNSLYRKTIGLSRDDVAFCRFLNYRNMYNALKRSAKESYYADLLQQYKNDIRKTWNVLNNLVCRRQDKSTISDTFLVDGNKETNKSIIANNFCDFFTNIGKQYADSISVSRRSSTDYMRSAPNANSIYFSPTDSIEVLHIIKTCKSKKSSGDDGISMTLLKAIAESCSEPIADLINRSLQCGIVPNAMKLAKVIPVYKAKCKETFGNYRPISLLSCISKILEKVVHKRLLNFLDSNAILYPRQYGFRPGRSTVDAITEFTSDIVSALDNKHSALAVFLDLSKAFDTINHQILLTKLHHYGVRGVALDWFQSYLSCRNQYVSFKGVHSVTNSVNIGVPQGSVLGPLLFIIYTNDIPMSIKSSKPILFADDTTVFVIGENVESLYKQMNDDLMELNDWFKANYLSVNPNKTKCMLFTRQRDAKVHNYKLFVEHEVLEKVSHTKFLGVHIDDQFTWQHQIDHCCKKVSCGVYAMNMSKRIISANNLKILYYSLVHPYLIYGIRLWGSCLKKYIHKLEVLQNRALRSMTNGKYNDPTSPMYKSMNILKLKDLFIHEQYMFMYSFVNKLLPDPLLNLYEYHYDVHMYNTRHANDPRPPQANSSILTRSFLYQAPKLWSNLSDNLKHSRSRNIFKRRIKTTLLNQL